MAGAFVGLDGRGSEVWVQTGPGKIVALDDSREKTAQVTVLGEGLKHRTHGWIPKNDPLFPKIKEAFDQKRDIEYRIESQRKSTVDPDIPIRKLRETMETAKENTIQIFAGLDGELSQEAVTNPRHDSAGGRVRAGDDMPATGSTADVATLLSAISEARAKSAAESFVSALMAHAVVAGASVDDVLAAASGRRVSSVSAPAQASSAKAESAQSEQPAPTTEEPQEPVEIFAPVEDDPSAERASADTVDSLKSLVTEAEVTDMSLVSGILNYTFGTGVARNVSDDNLGDFVDFYVANGPENFRAALAKVAKG